MADTVDRVVNDAEVAGKRALCFFQEMFSDENKVPSSTRLLMFLFGLFAMGVIGAIVGCMLKTRDMGVLGLWLTHFPIIVTVLTGLMVAPYTVSRGAGSMTDLWTALTSARARTDSNPERR